MLQKELSTHNESAENRLKTAEGRRTLTKNTEIDLGDNYFEVEGALPINLLNLSEVGLGQGSLVLRGSLGSTDRQNHQFR